MLARKNLIVDASKVRQLAAKLKTSESEAVRRAVDTLLLDSQVVEAVARIRARGTLRDVYHRIRRSAR